MQLPSVSMQEPDLANIETKKVGTPNKKKGKSTLRKAPQAPKRFKSSYILFFVHVQVKIKAELGGRASAPLVSKKASELWKALNAEERQHWDDEAMKEKERYMAEKAAYTGPWQVPHKRAKKDPSAPKRNPSAFLLFSQGKRRELKNLNPGMKNTEISRVLGQLWRTTPEEEKRPHIEREVKERERYKIAMAEWRRQQEVIQLTGKVGDTVCTSSNSADGDTGRKVKPISLEDSVGSRVHSGGGNAYDLYAYASQNHGASQGNYGANMYPPRMMLYSQQQHNIQSHMYPQHPPQEHYRNGYTKDVYPPGSGGHHSRHEQQHHRHSRPPHGNNCANETDFNPFPFSNTHGPSQGESQMQQREDYGNCYPPPNDAEHRPLTNITRENEIDRRQHHYQPQHKQRAMEPNVTRAMPFGNFDMIEQRGAQDKINEDDCNLDRHGLYNGQQHQYAQDNVTQDKSHQDQRHYYTQDNIKRHNSDMDSHIHHHQQQHRQHDMDQNIPHIVTSEQPDGTQQQYAPPRYDQEETGSGRGFSPFDVYANGEFDPVPIS